MLRTLKPIVLALLVAGAGAATAQIVEGIDLGALRERVAGVRSEAAETVADAQRQSASFQDEAAEIAEGATTNIQTLAETTLVSDPDDAIDFDAMLASAAQAVERPENSAPLFVAFASLSMPEQALRQLITDVSRAGGVVVFRGFPDNSGRAFVTQLGAVLGENPGEVSITIDPRLFRAFSIDAVPAYVVASRGFELCESLTCTTAPPAHDRMLGNVTAAYALQAFVDDGGPGARVAAVALANLQDSGQ